MCIRDSTSAHACGLNLRVVFGGKTGYAYTEVFDNADALVELSLIHIWNAAVNAYPAQVVNALSTVETRRRITVINSCLRFFVIRFL